MQPAGFEMVEMLSPDALERHPVWTPFRPEHRPWILGWGVTPERLDAELERYEYCGPEPLVPVLDCEPLPDREDLIFAATVRLACGRELPGYQMPPLAFGVFAEGQDWSFNRSLPSFARRVAEKLAAALGIQVEGIFPMRWEAPVKGPDGERLSGEIVAPW